MVADDAPVELRGTKVGAVLAMLSLRPGQTVSTERLAEGLWADDPPASAMNTLQTYISQLRRALGRDSIVTRTPGYLLAISPEAVDVQRFERLIADGRTALSAGQVEDGAARFEAALRLWRGPALSDFAYEPFALAEAARLEELRLVATEELVDARLALGQHAELAGELRALVEEHPLRERLWSQLMRALYRCGRQAEALRAYSELRRRLGDELGIEPSPALKRLEGAMLAQRSDLEWREPPVEPPVDDSLSRPPHNLPVARSTFVGRDDELTQLEKLTSTAAVVTVVGPGGSGKSRLALELAHHVMATYPAGVWLVELASISDPALLPQAVAAAMGVGEEPGRSWIESLVTAVGDGTLLVLDNCEHLAEACAALVDALVRATAGVTVLATSREPLRVDGEALWRIPTLSAPEDDSMPPDVLIQYDAVRLFVERATAQGNYDWPTSASGVARVCRRLDGLPLAIELAAARTRVLTPAVIADRLDDRFDLLTAGTRTGLPRHRTLRATVDWSYHLLQPAERILFRRLSVFVGGFTVEAAEAVCSDEDLRRSQVLEVLATLVDRSLVTTTERAGEVRYSLHETLRAYAEERLRETDEVRTVRARHLSWVLSFAESQKDGLAPQFVTQRSTLDLVELEHDNIRHALTWALSADPGAALRLVAAIGSFWRLRGYLEEGARWNEAVLAAAPQGDASLRALVLRRAGSVALNQGDVRRGRSLLERSAVMFREIGDEHAAAVALEQLIWPAFDHDRDLEAAEQLARQCMEIHTRLGDDHLASEARAILATIRLRRGDEESGRALMDQALDYNVRNAGDPCPMLVAHAGLQALLRGELRQARQRLEEAVAHSRVTGQPFHLAIHLAWLGEVEFLDGHVEIATRMFDEQLAIARKQGVWVWTRHALLWLARVALRRGDRTVGRPSWEEAQRMSLRRGSATDPEELEVGAELLMAEGQCEEAARMLGAADALRTATGQPVPAAYRPNLDRLRSEIAVALNPGPFDAASNEGPRMAIP